MPNATAAVRISPMLAVANMDESIAFYQNVLGFTVTLKSPEYSIIARDGQTIHLQLAANDEVLRCVRDHTEIYIEVTNITALWQNLQRPLPHPRPLPPRLRHDRIPYRRPQFLPGLRRRTHRQHP